jgi:hypothetical protein
MLQGDRRVTIREVEYHNDEHFSRRIPPRALSQQGFPGVLNAAARLRLAISGALPFMFFTTQAMALGLGPAQVHSSLGEPLHVVIPVSAGSADEAGCVTVAGGNELPAPIRPRVEVQSLPSGSIVIDLTTPLPSNEPALAFTVSAGCQSAVSRTYTLFLDPPQAAPQLPSVGGVVSTPLVSTPIATSSSRHRRRASSAASATGTNSSAAPADQGSLPPLAAPRRPPASEVVAPRREHAAASIVPPVPHPASSTPSSADRFHLSNDIGTDLRLADSLGTPDAQPIDAQQLEQLKSERIRLAAILAGQDPNVASATPPAPSAHEVELQNRVNGMSTQIATLQKQLTLQSEQNKELAAARSPGYLTWVFGVVALLALAVASWFGFRYRRAQGENLDQPWWEQSQLANVTERGGGETPFAVRPDGVAAPAAIVEPEVLDLDHDTFIQTTKMSASARPVVVDSMPLHDQEPSTVARGPVTVPMVTPPAPVAPLSSASPSPSSSSGATSPTAASLISPLAPGAAPTSQYGDTKTSHGTLDERIDSGSPKPLDFNLDLPPVTTNLGRDDRGVASQGSLQNAPAERPTELAPLDFELPRGSAEADAPSMGPDTILRLDEQATAAGAVQLANSETEAEHASVQFRLIQFASVVEQAEELERTNEPTKAIATLRQYVLRDETIPTLMWLMLFALYKQVNKRPVYDALGEHFSRRYKRPMARWDESLQSIAPQTPLASLPELDAALKAKWGTQAGIEMLRLLTCGRDQPNEVIFNAALQRDLLQMAKVFPLNDSI